MPDQQEQMQDRDLEATKLADLDEKFEAAVSGLAKANALGIAACLAAAFKEDVAVAFPLGCFLIAAFGYGLIRLSLLLASADSIIIVLRRTWDDTGLFERLYGPPPSAVDSDRFIRLGAACQFFGAGLQIAFFLIGVVAGFVIVAF